MPFTNGENVGAYRIMTSLGQGGVATVYKAYHPALDRLVAIKVLHPAFKADPNFLERFRREARVVARLEHPNIVPIYDFSEHQEQPYLVMKYIEGETLKARLARSPLSLQEGLRVVEAVGQGLSHAHQRGILHRDVKPSNILLENNTGIYLADFGLARIAAAGESTLSSDMLMGTPQYISPEQARGERDLDPRTDVYSFGVVLYEIVVGRVPFQADTPFSIIHDHIYTPLPLPSIINANVPEHVERVLLKSLAKNREDRFDCVDAMIGAFRAACEGRSIGTFTVPAVEDTAINPAQERSIPHKGVRPGEKKLRLRWLWLAAGIVITCLSALTLLSILDPGADETGNGEQGVPAAEQAVTSDQIRGESSESFDLGDDSGELREAELLADDAARLAENGLFILAAQMYLDALNFPNLPEEFVIRTREHLFNVLYLAAGAGDEIGFLLEDTLQQQGGSMDLDPVELRVKLFAEGPEHVRADVEARLARDPESMELHLLRAEVMLQLKLEAPFNEEIDFLLGREQLPDWIWEMAMNLDRKFYEK